METRIMLDALTADSVSIKTERYTTVEGETYMLGEPHRCAYINSAADRERMRAEVAEPYLAAILAVWGDTPTIIEEARQHIRELEGST